MACIARPILSWALTVALLVNFVLPFSSLTKRNRADRLEASTWLRWRKELVMPRVSYSGVIDSSTASLLTPGLNFD